MQYVIIGSSAAGINAIEAIRKKDKSSKITVITDEKTPLYSRCLISYLLAGTIKESKVWYRKDSFFKENDVEALLGVKAIKIDKDKKEVLLEDKKKKKFDKLLIAAGSSPKLEEIPGIDKKGVFPLRTIEHALQIQSMLGKVKKVSVLGGGLIGLRAAYALKTNNKDVTVFVRSGQILSQIIDTEAANIMQKRIEEKGIKVRTQSYAKEIFGNKDVEGLVLDDGSKIDCELIIIGKGVAPNIAIAKDAGIAVRNGIIMNKFLETSQKDIFSAGDVAETFDIASEESSINAIWPAACEQGRAAGLNMLGENTVYEGSLAMNSIEFFGLPVISIGITKPKKDAYKESIRLDKEKSIYKKVVTKNGVIVGAVFVNAIDTVGIVGALIKNRVDISGIEGIILEDYFDYGKIINIIKDQKHGFNEEEFKETTMSLS